MHGLQNWQLLRNLSLLVLCCRQSALVKLQLLSMPVLLLLCTCTVAVCYTAHMMLSCQTNAATACADLCLPGPAAQHLGVAQQINALMGSLKAVCVVCFPSLRILQAVHSTPSRLLGWQLPCAVPQGLPPEAGAQRCS